MKGMKGKERKRSRFIRKKKKRMLDQRITGSSQKISSNSEEDVGLPEVDQSGNSF